MNHEQLDEYNEKRGQLKGMRAELELKHIEAVLEQNWENASRFAHRLGHVEHALRRLEESA